MSLLRTGHINSSIPDLYPPQRSIMSAKFTLPAVTSSAKWYASSKNGPKMMMVHTENKWPNFGVPKKVTNEEVVACIFKRETKINTTNYL